MGYGDELSDRVLSDELDACYHIRDVIAPARPLGHSDRPVD